MQVREEMHATFHQACRFFWAPAYVLEQCSELQSANLPQSADLRSADLPRAGMPSALVHVTRHPERESVSQSVCESVSQWVSQWVSQ